MDEDLPFTVEYAKSGRATCKKCEETIRKGSIRMAIMVKSLFLDREIPTWHHLNCFFQKKNTLKCTTQIANFNNLRWEDQENIKNNLGSEFNGAESLENSDFSVEYAKSNKRKCRSCAEKISSKECEKLPKELKPDYNFILPKAVQELICLIFDIEVMEKTMVEFEIDLNKMPLGKLSKKQIILAYKVLGEAQQILVTGSRIAKIKDATNRFFTLIPHDFGMKKPPLLDHDEIIKAKIEMLDSLMEIEFAFNVIEREQHNSKDPVRELYQKLNTDITVLEEESSEYKLINTYFENTDLSSTYSKLFKLDQVFKISRHGEDERYKAFKGLHNKKLLWHGSRLTNYVGILSQGLHIAPPEAPATGYMFGKGIYFADIVSKSINYCGVTSATRLMLLCEVALGNMYEKINVENILKLPKQKHSTIGMGRFIPDPKQKTFILDVEVPHGKPVPSDNALYNALMYNEYIVYNPSQVKIKYLLKLTANPLY